MNSRTAMFVDPTIPTRCDADHVQNSHHARASPNARLAHWHRAATARFVLVIRLRDAARRPTAGSVVPFELVDAVLEETDARDHQARLATLAR